MLLSHSLYIISFCFWFRHFILRLFFALRQCIYIICISLHQWPFSSNPCWWGTGAGIVYPAPEANGMPPLIPINHNVCLSATSRRPLSHGALYYILYFCDGNDAAKLFIALAGAKVRMKQRKSTCIFFQKNCKSSQIDILVK